MRIVVTVIEIWNMGLHMYQAKENKDKTSYTYPWAY